MASARHELPYEGGKEMLLVDEVDDKAFLEKVVRAMYAELPAPRNEAAPKALKEENDG